MIKGFVERVEAEEVSGWVYDTSEPDTHLHIDAFCGAEHLASGIADTYRPDLASGKIGQGDHAFKLRTKRAIEPDHLRDIIVRVRAEASSGTSELPRWDSGTRRYLTLADAPRLASGSYRDETQFPVFVLGAPRSGTSAVIQALRAETPYTGDNEGHVIDLLTPLLDALRRFYDSKAEEVAAPEHNAMIRRIPQEYFSTGISRLLADAVRKLFPEGRWVDKTPTPEMIWAAPHLRQIWPNARFIFCKRRAFENLASRLRKFHASDFEFQCREWTTSMEAWLAVRPQLAGCALELDQHFLARHPKWASQAIGALLGLEPEMIDSLGRVLGSHQPERTAASIFDVCVPAALDWSQDQWSVFERVCEPMMIEYGYSRDAAYYAAGREAHACRPV